MIVGVAAWAYFTLDGLASAAGLFVGIFGLLVLLGLSIGVLTEDVGSRAWTSVSALVRRVRHRGSIRDLCGLCARVIVNIGSVRTCTSCDRIPVPITPGVSA
jgi:hypothetical protein